MVRANENSNRLRIARAGANKVISPYDIGADRMANVILRPQVEYFIETVTQDNRQDHIFDEMLINKNSELIGKNLAEIDVRNRFGILIIAIIPNGERIKFTPQSTDIINEGDSLILLGDMHKIEEFRSDMCKDWRSLAERAAQIKKTN